MYMGADPRCRLPLAAKNSNGMVIVGVFPCKQLWVCVAACDIFRSEIRFLAQIASYHRQDRMYILKKE